MEVIAVEGSLTDYEVLELIQSPTYHNIPDMETHHANRRQLQQQQKKLETMMNPHESSLGTLQAQLNAGQISESDFRAQCSRIIQKTSGTTKQLSTIRSELAYSYRIENTIWVKAQLLQYLNTQACRDQNHDDLTKFFTALDLWQSQWYLTLEPSELTMLINLRPVTDTLLPHILNGFFDRVPQPEAREQLIRIIELLPPPPPIEYVETAQYGELGQDDEIEEDIDEGDEVEPDEFDTSFAAQRDQDDDGANDSD